LPEKIWVEPYFTKKGKVIKGYFKEVPVKQANKPSEPAQKAGMLWCFTCSKEATPQCVTDHTTIWKEKWEEEMKHLVEASPLVKQAVGEGKVPYPKPEAAVVGKSIIQALKDVTATIQGTTITELEVSTKGNQPMCEICREKVSEWSYQGVRVCNPCYQELRS
jgi:hypothetical protein